MGITHIPKTADFLKPNKVRKKKLSVTPEIAPQGKAPTSRDLRCAERKGKLNH